MMHVRTLPPRLNTKKIVLTLVFICLANGAFADTPEVGTSPWGPDDEIGRMNLITEASRARALDNLDGTKAYDLAVDYFIGMPSWQAAGDPRFQMWLTHTPRGTVVDDPLNQSDAVNRHVSYTGSAFSMYAHMGTHIDALNHFGLNGKIWNHFSADEHLGDRGWHKTGMEKYPPMIARGVLLDVAGAKDVPELASGYRITREDIELTLKHQHTRIRAGDVVLIRTGRMRHYENTPAYMSNAPGLGMAAAQFLAEEKQALSIGADNLSFEAFPSEVSNNYVPVHTYLLAQQGVTIMELVYLEELAADKVFEFAFFGLPLKIRGGDAAPLRPLAIPYQ